MDHLCDILSILWPLFFETLHKIQKIVIFVSKNRWKFWKMYEIFEKLREIRFIHTRIFWYNFNPVLIDSADTCAFFIPYFICTVNLLSEIQFKGTRTVSFILIQSSLTLNFLDKLNFFQVPTELTFFLLKNDFHKNLYLLMINIYKFLHFIDFNRFMDKTFLLSWNTITFHDIQTPEFSTFHIRCKLYIKWNIIHK